MEFISGVFGIILIVLFWYFLLGLSTAVYEFVEQINGKRIYMSRWPKVPGGGVKGMSNPIYWVRRSNQDSRYGKQSIVVVEKFNERWDRLCRIRDHVKTILIEVADEDRQFSISVVDNSAAMKKVNKNMERINVTRIDAENNYKYLNEHIDEATNADLSKYATSVKKYALATLEFVATYKLCDFQSFSYVSDEKSIYVNGEKFFYLG